MGSETHKHTHTPVMDGNLKAQIVSVCCGKVLRWYSGPACSGGEECLLCPVVSQLSSLPAAPPLTLCDHWDRAGRALLSYSHPPPKGHFGVSKYSQRHPRRRVMNTRNSKTWLLDVNERR